MITTIVLSWNTSYAALACMQSVDEARANAPELVGQKILVNNNSTDENTAIITDGLSGFPNWTYLYSDYNRGFAGGMNLGLNEAIARDPAYVLFLNADTQLEPSFFQYLEDYLQENTDKDWIGFTIKTTGQSEPLTLGGYSYLSWFGAAISCRPTTGLGLPCFRARRLDYIDGCAMLCSAPLLHESSGIPEHHFMYFEELELSQFVKSRKRIGVCEGGIVYHRGGVATAQLPNELHPSYLAALACFSFTKRHMPWKLPSVLVSRLFWLALKSLWELDSQHLLGWFKAAQQFIFHGSAKPSKE